jgi:hypothetical protein
MSRYILILTILFFSCSRDPKLRLAEISVINKDCTIDSLKTTNGSLISVNPPSVFSNTIYYYNTKNKLYFIDQGKQFNGDRLRFKLVTDSLLFFYSDNFDQGFGNFWLIKNKNGLDYKFDNIVNDSLCQWSVRYSHGRLIEIGQTKCNIDSVYMKSLHDKIYLIEKDSLIEYANYRHFQFHRLFKEGVYYFSYPGRKIDFIINLNEYN